MRRCCLERPFQQKMNHHAAALVYNKMYNMTINVNKCLYRLIVEDFALHLGQLLPL